MVEFVGRKELLALLDRAIGDAGVVALVGPSGVGKTALAQHWLARRRERERFVAVDASHRSSMEVAAELMTRAAHPPEARLDEDELWAGAAQALADVDTIFVDDVGFSPKAFQTLSSLWRGTILITTHRPPEAENVKVLPVAPFETGPTPTVTDSDAARLFISVAKAADLRFDPEASAQAVAAILDLCDGFPLAIVLAARWSSTLSCEVVLKLLEEGNYPEDDENPRRHRSMQAAIHFSWEQLEEAQRARLYAMSLMAAPASVATISELCDEPQVDTARGLHGLVQMSIVDRGPQHRPLTSFSEHALHVFPEQHPRHADQIVHRLVELATRRARQQVDKLSLFAVPDTDGTLWDAAVSFAPRIDDRDLGVVLAAWLHWLLFRVSAEERRRRLEEAQPLYERADDWHVWYWLQRVLRYERDQRLAQVIERAKAVARTPEQRRDILLDEAQFHYLNLRLDEAAQTLEEAVEQAEPTFLYYYQRAEFLVYQGRKGDAFEATERAESLLGADQEIHRARLEMLRALCELDPTDKQARIESARDIYRRFHMIGAQGWCAHWLATSVGREQDRFDEAGELFDEARRHYASVGRRRDQVVIDFEEALLELHASHWSRAIELCQTVENQVTDNDLIPIEPVRLVRGIAALQSGRMPMAQRVWRNDRSHWTEADHVYLESLFMAFDAMLSVETGQPEAVRAASEEADDDIALRLRGLVSLDTYEADDLKSALAIWPELRPALVDHTGISVAARQLTIWLSARLPPMLARLHRLEQQGRGVCFVADFSAFWVDDQWVDIQTQATARTILRALCTSDAPMDFEDLAELLYPDQHLTHQSLVNRINVQISKLRKLGLKDQLVKRPDGFVFKGAFTLD